MCEGWAETEKQMRADKQRRTSQEGGPQLTDAVPARAIATQEMISQDAPRRQYASELASSL